MPVKNKKRPQKTVSVKDRLMLQLQESGQTLWQLAEGTSEIEKAAMLLVASLKKGGKVVSFGNGGSAADAQHLAAELSGRFEKDRPGLGAVALTTNSSALTAIANDYDYDQIFSRQLENFVKKGDVVVAISTSGNSSNVLRGVRQAKKEGAQTIGWTGQNGGQLEGAVDVCIKIPSDRTSRIQEGHLAVLHCLCAIVEDELFPQIPSKK